MKSTRIKSFLVLLALLFGFQNSSFAQVEILWEKILYPPENYVWWGDFSIGKSSDGKIIIPMKAKHTQANYEEVTQLHILDSDGSTQEVGLYNFSDINSIIPIENQNYILAGNSKPSYGDFYLGIGNTSGEIFENYYFGGNQSDIANSVLYSSQNNVVIGGSSKSFNGDVSSNFGEEDFWILKLNDSFSIEWEENYGGSNSDILHDIIETSDNHFIAIGSSHSNDSLVGNNYGMEDIWIVNIDDQGIIQWEKNYGGSDQDIGKGIVETSDGGYMILAQSQSSDFDISQNKGGTDISLIKIDIEGQIEWERNYGGSSSELAKGILKDPGGNGFIIGALTFSNDFDVSQNFGEDDFWVFMVDNEGNLLWEKSFGGIHHDGISSMFFDSEGKLIIGGFSQSNPPDATLILKLDVLNIDFDNDGFLSADDCDDTNPDINPNSIEIPNNGIDEDCNGEDLLVSTLSLNEQTSFKVFPNPTHSKVYINAMEGSILNYTLRDYLSNKILQGSIQLGDEDFQINLEDYTNGIYILELSDGLNTSQIFKLLKIE